MKIYLVAFIAPFRKTQALFYSNADFRALQVTILNKKNELLFFSLRIMACGAGF